MNERNVEMNVIAGSTNGRGMSRTATIEAGQTPKDATVRIGRRRALLPSAMLLLSPFVGCGLFGTDFVPGDYAGDIPCTIEATNPTGETGSEDFDSSTTLVVDENGAVILNGIELVVGNQVLFAIPTADLSFEVTEISRDRGRMVVTYEPRPTLPGITVEGELSQTFSARDGRIDVSVEADLIATDVSGESVFAIDCAGSLDAQ